MISSTSGRPASGSWRHRTGSHLSVACAGLLVGLVPFLTWKGIWASHFTLKAAVLAPLSLGMALGSVLAGAGRVWRLPDRLDLAAVAFLGVAGVSTLLSGTPLTSFAGAYNHGIGLAVLGLAVVLFLAGRRLPASSLLALVQILVLAGSLLAVLVLAQRAGVAPVLHALGVPSTGRPQATLGNPNHAGAYLAAAGSAALALFLGGSSVSGRLAAGFAFVLAVAAVVVTFSRGAWLAVAVGCVAAVALLIARQRVRAGRRTIAAAGLLASGALAAGVWGSGLTSFVERLFSSDVASHGSTAYRFGLYEAALRGVASRPLVGWGPGGFGRVWQLHVTEAMLAIQPEDWAIDAHSLPLEILATVGIGGFVLFAGVTVMSFRRAFGRAGSSGPAAVAVLVACLALGVALSFNPQHVLLTPMLFLLLGVSAGPPLETSAAGLSRGGLPTWSGYLLLAVLVPALVASTAFGVRLVAADRQYLQAMVAADGYRTAAAARRLGLYSEPYFQAGRTLIADDNDAEAAVGLYFEGLALDPSSAYGRQSLAAALLDTRDYEEALDQAREALALFPLDGQAFLVEASALASLGRGEEAQEAAQAALALPSAGALTYYRAAVILAPVVDGAGVRSILEAGLRSYPDDPDLRRMAAGLKARTEQGQ